MRWRKINILVLCFFLSIYFLFPGQKIREKDLPERYQEFLKLVNSIILPHEKDVFLQLTTDRDRDIFIEAFWKQRDPTPGTPQNEYREDIIKRFNYVNKFYGRGTVREGWMTDMGKFYMILGPPASIERFAGMLGIYPCEVWSYYGDKDKGLPPHFALVFYQKGGAGEYKLYDPVSDGPSRLLTHGMDIPMEDYETMYERIREIAPTLADVSVSLIPGDVPYNYQPSPQNTILLAEIIQSPKRDINPGYATHFLSYKGMVSTEYMTNYVESEARTALIRDPLMEVDFLHFSIMPKSLSIDYYEPKDQFFCNFTLSVSLRKGENIIFQYSRDYPFYFSPDDLPIIQNNGISIEDSFPLIPGKYRLIVLLQNSVGKEFSVYEKDVGIPEDSGLPFLSGPFLGYRVQDYRQDLHIPFKVLDKKLVLDPKNTFASREDVQFVFTASNLPRSLWENGKANVFVRGFKEIDPVQKSFDILLRDHPFRKTLFINGFIPNEDLPPDYYEMTLNLMDEKGAVLDKKTATFVISPFEAVAHPVAHSRAFPLSNNFLYFHMLARQYEKTGEFQKADEFYQKTREQNPAYREAQVDYAGFLIKTGKFEESLEVIENVRDDEKFRFQYYLLKGSALIGKSDYARAIESLLEANKIYDSDTTLLNSLGICYLRTNQRDKALNVLRASLRLNPEQEETRRLIEEAQKKPRFP